MLTSGLNILKRKLPPGYLSPHFTLAEFVHSTIAARIPIDNTPSAAVIENLTRLAATLERVRVVLLSRIVLLSGYRCEQLNKVVKGSPTSMHRYGLAGDFIAVDTAGTLAAARKLADSDIEFDQLIYEGEWIHLGLAPLGTTPRREILTAHFNGRAPRYSAGL